MATDLKRDTIRALRDDLVRKLKDAGFTAREIGEFFPKRGGKPLTVRRVQQIVADMRRLEKAARG